MIAQPGIPWGRWSVSSDWRTGDSERVRKVPCWQWDRERESEPIISLWQGCCWSDEWPTYNQTLGTQRCCNRYPTLTIWLVVNCIDSKQQSLEIICQKCASGCVNGRVFCHHVILHKLSLHFLQLFSPSLKTFMKYSIRVLFQLKFGRQ